MDKIFNFLCCLLSISIGRKSNGSLVLQTKSGKFLSFLLNYAIPEKRSSEIPRGREILQVKILEAKYEV